jgi:hypothetical protein
MVYFYDLFWLLETEFHKIEQSKALDMHLKLKIHFKDFLYNQYVHNNYQSLFTSVTPR